MAAYRIGIDLGGTNIAAGIVDDSFRILIKGSVKTRAPRPYEEICRDMVSLSVQLCEKAGISFEKDILSIGIGSPGIIENGSVLVADNLAFRNAPLASEITALTGKPATLRNDGNAAAYGELVAGCGKGCRSLVAITLGTGVGGGIVQNGEIVTGFNGAAGEVGHIIIHGGGRPCACGKRGCLEAYASATGLMLSTRLAMEAHPESQMWELAPTLKEVNGHTAFDAMRLGDGTAASVVDEFISDLAIGASNMINLLQPEVLCIGGGISNEGDTLLVPLRRKIAEQTYTADGRSTGVVAAMLGNDAGIIGAAAE